MGSTDGELMGNVSPQSLPTHQEFNTRRHGPEQIASSGVQPKNPIFTLKGRRHLLLREAQARVPQHDAIAETDEGISKLAGCRHSPCRAWACFAHCLPFCCPLTQTLPRRLCRRSPRPNSPGLGSELSIRSPFSRSGGDKSHAGYAASCRSDEKSRLLETPEAGRPTCNVPCATITGVSAEQHSTTTPAPPAHPRLFEFRTPYLPQLHRSGPAVGASDRPEDGERDLVGDCLRVSPSPAVAQQPSQKGSTPRETSSHGHERCAGQPTPHLHHREQSLHPGEEEMPGGGSGVAGDRASQEGHHHNDSVEGDGPRCRKTCERDPMKIVRHEKRRQGKGAHVYKQFRVKSPKNTLPVLPPCLTRSMPDPVL